MENIDRIECPRSATHGGVAALGVGAFLAAMGIVRIEHPFGNDVVRTALFVMAATAGAIFLADLMWQKVYLRKSTGIDFAYDNPSWRRTIIKFFGLLASLGFVAFLYWLLPEYSGSFYDLYYAMLRVVLPVWLLLAVPYIYVVDRHMPKPQDGYWHFGQLVSMHWEDMDWGVVRQHLLGWLIKGFFLPLMFTQMCNDIDKFSIYDASQLVSFRVCFDLFFDLFYFIDVGLVSVGYLMSLRVTDTQFRSAEPTLLGWFVALVCYEPFWSLIGRQYLAYDTSFKWGAWLWKSPIIYGIWGVMILVLTGIYVWSTIIFGARFSNLTHRGIITNGPYRWTKHPAYISKNLSWWLISIPFLAPGSFVDVLKHCLLLLCLNGIYLLRAKTEERHLSWDEDYRRYALWIKSNGLFGGLGRYVSGAKVERV